MLTGCALRPALSPEEAENKRLLGEIIARAGDGIRVIKVIADIDVEKNSAPADQMTASLLFRKDGWVHARIYRFGVLTNDMVLKEGEFFLHEGKGDIRAAVVLYKLYQAVFWWEGMQDGSLLQNGNEYVISSDDKVVRLDKTSLLPLSQNIRALNKNISIRYSEPKDYNGPIYPSLLQVDLDRTRITVRITKLLKDPVLGENDFKTQ